MSSRDTGHDAEVRRRFSASADYYTTSATHAAGPDLAWMLEALQPRPEELALDVATGTGHAALALAPHVHRVVALDLTPAMLEKARLLVAERGAANVCWTEGSVERLPFPGGLFDLVVCRIAAHHFADPAGATAEMARVLAAGGRLALIDNVGPEDPALDDWVNALDRLHDPTHVRMLPIRAWEGHLRAAGLRAGLVRRWDSPLDAASWAASAPDPGAVQAWLDAAPGRAREAFRVDGSRFVLEKALILAARD